LLIIPKILNVIAGSWCLPLSLRWFLTFSRCDVAVLQEFADDLLTKLLNRRAFPHLQGQDAVEHRRRCETQVLLMIDTTTSRPSTTLTASGIAMPSRARRSDDR